MLGVEYIEDKKWTEAKSIAQSNGLTQNWIAISEIYHYIGGRLTHLYATIEQGKTVEVIGRVNTEHVLVINSDEQASLVDYSQLMLSKKYFNSVSENELVSKSFDLSTFEVSNDTLVAQLSQDGKLTLTLER